MENSKNVAFLDVLGFSDFVDNNDHSVLINIYNNIFTIFTTLGLACGQVKFVNNNGSGYATPDVSYMNVNSLIVSDSIILWTDNSSPKSFEDIVSCVRQTLSLSFVSGLPLRGSIVEGQFHVSRNYYRTEKVPRAI